MITCDSFSYIMWWALLDDQCLLSFIFPFLPKVWFVFTYLVVRTAEWSILVCLFSILAQFLHSTRYQLGTIAVTDYFYQRTSPGLVWNRIWFLEIPLGWPIFQTLVPVSVYSEETILTSIFASSFFNTLIETRGF